MPKNISFTALVFSRRILAEEKARSDFIPKGLQFRNVEKRDSLLRSLPRSSVFPMKLLLNFVSYSSAGEDATLFNKGCWLSFSNQKLKIYRKRWIR